MNLKHDKFLFFVQIYTGHKIYFKQILIRLIRQKFSTCSYYYQSLLEIVQGNYL